MPTKKSSSPENKELKQIADKLEKQLKHKYSNHPTIKKLLKRYKQVEASFIVDDGEDLKLRILKF